MKLKYIKIHEYEWICNVFKNYFKITFNLSLVPPFFPWNREAVGNKNNKINFQKQRRPP